MFQALKQQLLASLDDIPRWVETRDLLLNPNSCLQIFSAPNSFAVWLEQDAIGAIIGTPTEPLGGISHCDEILAFNNNYQMLANLLPTHLCEHANIYQQSGEVGKSTHSVRSLTLHDIEPLAQSNNALFAELQWALFHGAPAFAALHHEQVVAFAYASAQSEHYWDMSIDTLAEHRQQGFACAAARALINAMNEQGKQGVWGALDSNEASNQLALKLGYQLVDELWLFSAQ